MRIAALYDVHANLPALEAVLADVRRIGVDLVVFGGDILPGPLPRETLDRALDVGIPTRFILGNGDRVVLAMARGEEAAEVPPPYRATIQWNAQQLDATHRRALESWPATTQLSSALGDVLFCHATPRNDIDIFTRDTPEARIAPAFEGTDASVVVCGHTHMQFDRHVRGHRVVNAGSVGMPFAEPGAYWLLIDDSIQLRRTTYDLQAAAARIRVSGYPEAEQFAASNVLEPPAEADMLARFSGA